MCSLCIPACHAISLLNLALRIFVLVFQQNKSSQYIYLVPLTQYYPVELFDFVQYGNFAHHRRKSRIAGGCKFVDVVNSWIYLIFAEVNSLGVYLSINCQRINIIFNQRQYLFVRYQTNSLRD